MRNTVSSVRTAALSTCRIPTRSLAAVAIFAGIAGTAKAQMPSTAIYPGGSPQSAGVVIVSSGSGTLTADSAHVYAGGGSLKLVTHGLYQGGAIDLKTPFDLGPLASNKNAYVQFAILPPTPPTGAGPAGTSSGKGFKGMMSGGPGGAGSGGPGGAGPGGGGGKQGDGPFGGSGMAGGKGGLGGPGGTAGKVSLFKKAEPLGNLRVVFVTSTGASVEKRIPMTYANDDAGWKVLSVPVSALDGISSSDGKVTEVRVYGDTTGTLYLGKIGVLVDTTRIMIESIESKVVTANQKYRYTATAHGGASALNYSWDWDDRDGIQNESEGRSATHTYRKSGDYNVTITVTDPYGVKEAASTKFQVHVP